MKALDVTGRLGPLDKGHSLRLVLCCAAFTIMGTILMEGMPLAAFLEPEFYLAAALVIAVVVTFTIVSGILGPLLLAPAAALLLYRAGQGFPECSVDCCMNDVMPALTLLGAFAVVPIASLSALWILARRRGCRLSKHTSNLALVAVMVPCLCLFFLGERRRFAETLDDSPACKVLFQY